MPISSPKSSECLNTNIDLNMANKNSDRIKQQPGKKCTNIEIMNAITKMSENLNSRISDIEVKLTERMDKLESAIEVKLLEKLGGMIENKVSEEVSKVHNMMTDSIANLKAELDSLRAVVNEPTQSSQPTVATNIVIWNLAKQEGEEDDSTVTINAVNKLIRDGLKLADVSAKSAIRKPRK
jgi:hypothetical protein